MRLVRALFLVSIIGCGGDDKEPAAGGDRSLAQALAETRAAGAALCAAMDECFPEYVEEDWCNYPEGVGGTTGLERHWPPAAADSCWDPLHEANPRAVLAFLACAKAADAIFAACIASCPEDAAGDACWDEYNEASDDCEPPFERELGDARLDAYETCTERLAPAPD